jgi:putative flippase GtrA
MLDRLIQAVLAMLGFFLGDRRLFVTYITVGAITVVIEFSLFNAFYGLLDMPLLAANLSAIGFVLLFSFFSHKHFSFRDRQAFHRQLPWYVFMLAVSISLNNLLVYLFVAVLGWPAPLSKLLQIGICFVWNFTFSRLVVFAQRHERDAETP